MLDARVLGGAACVAAVVLTSVPVAAKPPEKGAASAKALGDAVVAALQARDGAALRALVPSADVLRGMCNGDPASVARAVDALVALDPSAVAALDGITIGAERIDAPANDKKWPQLAVGVAWRGESEGWGKDACKLARPIQLENVYLHLLDHYGGLSKQAPIRLPVIRIDGRVYAVPFTPLLPQVAAGAAPLRPAVARMQRCQALAKHLVDLGAIDEVPANELKGFCDTVDNATADCAMAATTTDVVNRCATEMATAEQCTAAFAHRDALGGEEVTADQRNKELAECPTNTPAATARCAIAASTLEAFRACAETM
jgi:hypothetical protein